MKTLEASATNDLRLDAGGGLAFLNGLPATAQTAEQFASTRRGEMLHAMDFGIPFDLMAWGGTPNVAQFEAALRARLMETPEVLEVVALTARLNGDVLGYVATLRTTYGETIING